MGAAVGAPAAAMVEQQGGSLLAQGSPFPPGTMVVFVCPVGERSTRLAALACHNGQDAAGLTGGITAWRDAGLPLEISTRAR